MIITGLELKDYRNYDSLNINFDEKTNIFYGNNAQGKTNILEAVYLACTTKSHRRSKDREIIKFGSDEAHLRLFLKKNNVDYRIDMHLRKNKKKAVAVNGIPIKKASELLGIAKIVFFSPEDLNIIKNGPAERRRFTDMELCQLNKLYLSDLVNYNKCMEQRNRLLKDISSKFYKGGNIRDTLEIWDEQLINYGSKVIDHRREFILKLSSVIRDIHRELTGSDDILELIYENDVDPQNYRSKLKDAQNQDMKYCSTSVGPHRDDIKFSLAGIDLRKFGSQGQQRTVALALKLSEIELVRNMTKDEPVLLLDDVLSELDSNRQNFLLKSIGNIQTMVTCTGLDEFIKNRFEIDRVFNICNGKASLNRINEAKMEE